MPIDILLVDEHTIMRDGIKAILSRGNEFRVVGEAGNGPDAIELSKRLRPPLVLMAIGLPGLSGVETTQEILRFHGDCKIVILSMHDDENSVMGAIRAGARAFVVKRASETELVEALHLVAAGGIYLSPQVSGRLLSRLQKGDLESHQTHAALEVLSPRELQVLRLVAGGKASKEIASLLGLGQQTVRTYRKTMMQKLGVNNIAGLTQLALATGLVGQAAPDKSPDAIEDGLRPRKHDCLEPVKCPVCQSVDGPQIITGGIVIHAGTSSTVSPGLLADICDVAVAAAAPAGSTLGGE